MKHMRRSVELIELPFSNSDYRGFGLVRQVKLNLMMLWGVTMWLKRWAEGGKGEEGMRLEDSRNK